MDLIDCVDRLLDLKRWAGRAPHQPCLLLAIADLAEAGGLSNTNSIDIDNSVLVDSFSRYFGAVKSKDDSFMPDRAKPIVALIKNSILQCEVHEAHQDEVRKYFEKVNPNLSRIRRTLTNISVDPDILKWFLDQKGRHQIRDALIQRYFLKHSTKVWKILDHNRQVTQYAERVRSWDSESGKRFPPDHVRDLAFRRVILDIYDSKCAASHLKIVLPGIALIDAAHLIPFSETQDDDPRNGLALTPTYHRALDAHLIAPGIDNKWKISNVLKHALRDVGHEKLDPFRDFEGREVLQPLQKHKNLSPKRQALEWRLDNLLKI